MFVEYGIRPREERLPMHIGEVQAILDRINDMYGNTLSPQILRRAVEYGQVESMEPDLAGESGMSDVTTLAQRIQSYIGGYCDFVDGIVAEMPDDIEIEDDVVREVANKLRDERGETHSHAVFAGAAFNADVAAAARPESYPEAASRDSAANCILGYIDGYDQAERDLADGKFIRSMDPGFTREMHASIFDETAEEIMLEPEIADKLREPVVEGLDRVFTKYLYPRSGHVANTQTPPTSFGKIYFLGFIRGADSDHAIEKTMKKYSAAYGASQPASRVAMRKIVLDSQAAGLTRSTGERAAAAAAAYSETAVVTAPDGSIMPMTELDTVFGMGYAAGLHHLLGKRIERKDKGDVKHIAQEVDEIFASFDVSDLSDGMDA